MKKRMRNKKGQVTIFIIVAILIVIAVVLFFLLLKNPDANTPTSLGPQEFIESCVKDSVENSINIIMKNGGEITPSQIITYNGSNWNYLCFQADYYLSCYNLHPMLEKQIENEIFDNTANDVQDCFNAVRNDFESQGYEVGIEQGQGDTIYKIDLLPGYVDIKLSKEFYVLKDGNSQNFDDFSFRIVSPIYDLVQVTRDVVNSETEFCNFEYNGYMLLYPQYDITRVDYMDSKIYSLTDRKSKAEFKFAVRSCAFAPGI